MAARALIMHSADHDENRICERFGFLPLATRALALGEGLPTNGRLLDHRQADSTARYAHLARDEVRISVEPIAMRSAEYALRAPRSRRL